MQNQCMSGWLRVFAVMLLSSLAIAAATHRPHTRTVTLSLTKEQTASDSAVYPGLTICPRNVTAGTLVTCSVYTAQKGKQTTGCFVGLMLCPSSAVNTTTPTIMYNGTLVSKARYDFSWTPTTTGTFLVSGWYNMTFMMGTRVPLRVRPGPISDTASNSSCSVMNYTTMQTRCTMFFNDQFGNVVKSCINTYIPGGEYGAMSCSVL